MYIALFLENLFFQVAILKPMTSCPTSPERFLVCRGFTGCKSILTEVRSIYCIILLLLCRRYNIAKETLTKHRVYVQLVVSAPAESYEAPLHGYNSVLVRLSNVHVQGLHMCTSHCTLPPAGSVSLFIHSCAGKAAYTYYEPFWISGKSNLQKGC